MKFRAGALLLLSVLGLRVWWSVETEAPLAGATTEIVIPPGASTQGIAERLFAAGIIRRSWSFHLLVRMRGDGGRMKAGRYKFEGPYSMLDLEQKIVEGDVERREITFPEGRSLSDMADIAMKAGFNTDRFLAAAKDPGLIADLDPAAKNLEGYLFPETYELKDGSNEAGLVADMVKYTRGVFDELGLGPEGRTIAGLPLTLPQIVTLASIVELETAAPEERPRIAGVFLNRLRLGMKLQTDPTVIYALKLEGKYRGNIHKVDLSNDSPYNTYRFTGLPPGPIGSPGRSALNAVLQPEKTEALYFVSRNDGTHVFSKLLRDHEKAVDEYQRRRNSRMPRPGPSPAPPPPEK
jgi:UPF0755 protein